MTLPSAVASSSPSAPWVIAAARSPPPAASSSSWAVSMPSAAASLCVDLDEVGAGAQACREAVVARVEGDLGAALVGDGGEPAVGVGGRARRQRAGDRDPAGVVGDPLDDLFERRPVAVADLRRGLVELGQRPVGGDAQRHPGLARARRPRRARCPPRRARPRPSGRRGRRAARWRAPRRRGCCAARAALSALPPGTATTRCGRWIVPSSSAWISCWRSIDGDAATKAIMRARAPRRVSAGRRCRRRGACSARRTRTRAPAPARLAGRSPRNHAARKPASNESPAPVLSTTSMRGAGHPRGLAAADGQRSARRRA